MPSPIVRFVDAENIAWMIEVNVLSTQVTRPTIVFMNHAQTTTQGELTEQNSHAISWPNAATGFVVQSEIVGAVHNHYASSEAVSTSFSDWSMNMPTIHMKK